MEALFNGIGFGLILAFLVGPVFFALLQTSLEHGFLAGAKMIVGIALSDILFIVVAYFGMAPIAQTPAFQYWMGIVGGIIMIIFGLASLFKKPPSKEKTAEEKTFKRIRGWRLALRAFALNGLNPFVLIFWLTTTSTIIGRYPNSPLDHGLFLTGMTLTAIGTDLGKAYAARKLSTILTPKIMLYINIAVGLALVLFGARTIYMVWAMV